MLKTRLRLDQDVLVIQQVDNAGKVIDGAVRSLYDFRYRNSRGALTTDRVADVTPAQRRAWLEAIADDMFRHGRRVQLLDSPVPASPSTVEEP